MTAPLEATDTTTAEHYVWGEQCDGWHLLKQADLSVIQEHVPPQVPHRFANHGETDVVFLVISSPSTAGDRINLATGL